MRERVTKFSKSFKDILSIKKGFINENKKHLQRSIRVNQKYIKQPKRKKCKNCQVKISDALFNQFKVNYTMCKRCGHLNGAHEDNVKFINWLYSEKNRSDNYKAKTFYPYKDYNERVKKIYLPKVTFLKEVIKTKINVLDIGAGGGYFLKALEIKNIDGIGYEPNKYLVNMGNKNIKKNKLINLSLNESYKKVLDTNGANVLSMIGVLEHLNKPNYILQLFKKSKIKYLYISVPTLSLSVLLENVFNNVFPRQLSGGHTHLYTKKSLDFLAKKNKLKIIGEWWFGTDFGDLYRSLLTSSKNYNFKKYKSIIDANLLSVIDKLQSVLDKRKICSEVHMVFKK